MLAHGQVVRGHDLSLLEVVGDLEVEARGVLEPADRRPGRRQLRTVEREADGEAVHDGRGVTLGEVGTASLDVGDDDAVPVLCAEVRAVPGRSLEGTDRTTAPEDVGGSTLGNATVPEDRETSAADGPEHALRIALGDAVLFGPMCHDKPPSRTDRRTESVDVRWELSPGPP
jgi:hypothetical protein